MRKHHPSPTPAEVYRLCAATGVSPNTVKKWLAGGRLTPALQKALEDAKAKEAPAA
jgi:hypothetical protein